ncbi:hypothetical protein NDU88_011328 [Pleurodeles waltl]|uniref:Uncharacterized protein n=1 Tax=Pleurodeles waltl TaxID=8319 RepID=A0AAV7QXA6_PLEWA|nr:hypothetical protein NDU88_011328 [Pleurodeles waltl]
MWCRDRRGDRWCPTTLRGDRRVANEDGPLVRGLVSVGPCQGSPQPVKLWPETGGASTPWPPTLAVVSEVTSGAPEADGARRWGRRRPIVMWWACYSGTGWGCGARKLRTRLGCPHWWSAGPA